MWDRVTSFVVIGQRAAVNVSLRVPESGAPGATGDERDTQMAPTQLSNWLHWTKCGARNRVSVGRNREKKKLRSTGTDH